MDDETDGADTTDTTDDTDAPDAVDAPDPPDPPPMPGQGDGADGAANDDAAAPQGDPSAAAAAALPAPRNLPEKPIAALYNAMTPDWGDPFTVISRALTLKRYLGADTVLPMNDVEQLKHLPGGGIGVLVMFAHGSFADDGTFFIATSHVTNPTDDGTFADDLHPKDGTAPTLVTHKVPIDPSWATTTTNYCITGAFVEKYWAGKFCKDSLAVFCTCSLLDGSHPSAIDFVHELTDMAHVSTVLGWDNEANTGDMSGVAIFLVDRLLGANDPGATPEQTPQRPFDIGSVLTDMGDYKNGAGGRFGTSLTVRPGVINTTPAQLVATPTSDSHAFGILAPSILKLDMMAIQTQLAIAGCFGDDPGPDRGVVKMNGAPVPYISWAPDQILCPLLVSDEAGPATSQAAGRVVVEVDGRPSNCVPLTEWRGKLVFTVNGDGTQKLVCTWTYHLKADVHHFRARPGPEGFFDLPIRVFTLRDTSLTYAASGEVTTPGPPPQTTKWSGSGTLQPATDILAPRDTYVISAEIIRPEPPLLAGCYMLLGVTGGPDSWTYQVDADGSLSQTPAFGDWGDLCSSRPGPPFEGLNLKLPLDDQMGIAAGTYPFTVGDRSCTLEIHPEPTNFPPDPLKGEDQSVSPFGAP